MTVPEFSRPRRLDQIGAGASAVSIAASADECAALARRFGLIAIESLAAEFELRRVEHRVDATGQVSGAVIQPCIATGLPVSAVIREAVTIRFLPEPDETSDEIALDSDDVDTVFYTGSAVDLGEAAAETLALALDPFPRSPDADAALREAGVISEDAAGPFGALSTLKDRLAGKP